MLSSAEHDIFIANIRKYENANNSWHYLFINRENYTLNYV